MRKLGLVLLSLVLFAGCAPKDPEQEAEPASTETSEAVAEEPAIQVNYGTVQRTAQELAETIASSDTEACASFFSPASETPHESSDLAELFSITEGKTLSVTECDPYVRDGFAGAVILFEAEDQSEYECMFTLNGSLEIMKLGFAKRDVQVTAEDGEDWTETIIHAGNAPKITGVLCVPNEEEEAPIAVLMAEDISDPWNASGSNAELRKDLAHALAEHGIASVRFNGRLYEDPLLAEIFGYDLNLVRDEDFASIVHTLEQYPVNAGKIIYIGHGAAGALGYSSVYHHFEITGGLVLINAPFEEDGVHLFARAMWMEEETADEVSDLLADDEREVTEAAGFPLSYWAQWNDSGALRYTRYVSIPILIQQAEEDEIVRLKEDYDDWKSQKGSNVTMKSYEDLGHDLRNEDGVFEDLIAEDIADWLDGVDINKKKTDKDKDTAASTTGTTTGRKT